MALSTAYGASELYYLDLIHMLYPQRNWLEACSIGRNETIGQESVYLIFSQFANELLNVRRHILGYLKETEPIRKWDIIFLVFWNIINLLGLAKLLDGTKNVRKFSDLYYFFQSSLHCI